MTDIMFSIGNLLFNMWNKVNEFFEQKTLFFIILPLINITTLVQISPICLKKNIFWCILQL